MLTPKLPVAVIARALIVAEPSETRIVGGSADTDAKAVTVIPHGLSPTQQVTSPTPLASVLMASTKSAIGAGSCIGSVMRFRAGGMGLSLCDERLAAACSGPPTALAVGVTQSPRPP